MTGFDRDPVHVRTVVDAVALEQVYLPVCWFSLVSIFFLLFFFFFFFFFHWHYSPLWALACRTISFHFFPICHQLYPSSHSQHLKISFDFLFPSFPGSSSFSSSIGTTAHCGLWPVEQCPSIFSYRPPTLSIFSLPALEDLFRLPLSIFSWVFPFFLSLPVLE